MLCCWCECWYLGSVISMMDVLNLSSLSRLVWNADGVRVIVCVCVRERGQWVAPMLKINFSIYSQGMLEWMTVKEKSKAKVHFFLSHNKQPCSHAHQQAGLSSRRREKLLESCKVRECVSCSGSQYFTGFALLPTLHHKRGGIIMTTQADTVQTHALYNTIRS